MFRVFVKGIVFGAGFSLSVAVIVIIANIAMQAFLPVVTTSDNTVAEIQWHKLTKEEQIDKATAIAIVRYEDGPDNSKVAILDEIYKSSEKVTLKYKVGDPYPSLDYYPKDNYGIRSGAVVFFGGEPAQYRHALYMYNGRVTGYGDMPLGTFIKKYKSAHNKSLKERDRASRAAP